MVRKILSDLLSGLRSDFVSGARDGIAWGLAMSPPSRLTMLLEPLADQPTPRHSLPPCSEVVALATTDDVGLVARGRDNVAALLFFAWHCEMTLRARLANSRHAARVSARRSPQLYAVRGGL